MWGARTPTPTARVQVRDLREAAATAHSGGASTSASGPVITLIHSGKQLTDDSAHLADLLQPGDTVLVVPARRAPPADLQPPGERCEDDDEDDDVSLTRPPPDASPLHRAIGAWLKKRRAPDAVLVWCWLVKPWVWASILVREGVVGVKLAGASKVEVGGPGWEVRTAAAQPSCGGS